MCSGVAVPLQDDIGALDEKVVYIFLRQDVELKHQLVQYGHAIRRATQQTTLDIVKENFGDDFGVKLPHALGGEPFITVVGMPDIKSLDRVCIKLRDNGYKFVAFLDTAFDFGVACIVTDLMPLSVREKPNGLMCNYRLWNPANNTHPNDKYPPLMKGEA